MKLFISTLIPLLALPSIARAAGACPDVTNPDSGQGFAAFRWATLNFKLIATETDSASAGPSVNQPCLPCETDGSLWSKTY